jgi:hydroxysqualene dehydroxylase
MRLAVVGAGWAGLSAAVRATQAGHQVTVFEMAPQPGGRAKGIEQHGAALDNGQHILIGAYTQCLDLMRTVGADPQALLLRRPLELRYPDGRGLRLPTGPAVLSFARGVLACAAWSWSERVALLRTASGWVLRGFECDPAWNVAQLCKALPPAVMNLLIEPLCVAALNTPAHEASAQVFLRVLRDALFSGPGSADLLLPRALLSDLLPAPAWRWLTEQGASLHHGLRVQALEYSAQGWMVHAGAGLNPDAHPGLTLSTPFDRVLLACTATEAARLAAPHAPEWATLAASLRYEPIVTVYVHAHGAQLPCAMTSFASAGGQNPAQAAMAIPREVPPQGPSTTPAQFAFDLGALGGHAGRFSFVISGAADWVALGAERTGQAVLQQAQAVLSPAAAGGHIEPQLLAVVAEKRATFRCTPGLLRPAVPVATHLAAAGDYVAGPYPATLEGAVRSGITALQVLGLGTGHLTGTRLGPQGRGHAK